jgi:hypothetical protein
MVAVRRGANKAEAGLNRRTALFFREDSPHFSVRTHRGIRVLNSPQTRNLLAASALQIPAPLADRAEHKEFR